MRYTLTEVYWTSGFDPLHTSQPWRWSHQEFVLCVLLLCWSYSTSEDRHVDWTSLWATAGLKFGLSNWLAQSGLGSPTRCVVWWDCFSQEWEFLEFFAGTGNLSRQAQASGYHTVRFDILDNSTPPNRNSNFMDLNSTSGFACLDLKKTYSIHIAMACNDMYHYIHVKWRGDSLSYIIHLCFVIFIGYL